MENEKPTSSKPTSSRADVLEVLKEMLKVYEELPRDALFAPVTHADHHSLLLLLLALFKAES